LAGGEGTRSGAHGAECGRRGGRWGGAGSWSYNKPGGACLLEPLTVAPHPPPTWMVPALRLLAGPSGSGREPGQAGTEVYRVDGWLSRHGRSEVVPWRSLFLGRPGAVDDRGDETALWGAPGGGRRKNPGWGPRLIELMGHETITPTMGSAVGSKPQISRDPGNVLLGISGPEG